MFEDVGGEEVPLGVVADQEEPNDGREQEQGFKSIFLVEDDEEHMDYYHLISDEQSFSIDAEGVVSVDVVGDG